MSCALINRICFRVGISSLVTGTLIGLAAIWFGDLMSDAFITKSFATTTILFISSLLGALVTRLLVVREPMPSRDPLVSAMEDMCKLTVGEFREMRDRGEF